MVDPATNSGLHRYTLILDVVSLHPGGLTLSEIAKLTSLPKGTVHRFIRTLVAVGYLSDGNGHTKYRIGGKLLRISRLSEHSQSLDHMIEPVLGALAKSFDTTAYLSKLVGLQIVPLIVTIPKREGDSQTIVYPGRVMPVHAAASAKAIAAYQDSDILDRLLAQSFQKYTKDTIVEVGAVRAELESVRRSGYATCINEIDEGVVAYSVPVRISAETAFYSVSICGFKASFEKRSLEKIVAALQESSGEIAAIMKSSGNQIADKSETNSTF